MLRQLGSLRQLSLIDAVGKNESRLESEAMAAEFGWHFQGGCNCGCMDVDAPPLWRVTADAVKDGRVVLKIPEYVLRNSRPNGLRLRGPIKLEKLEIHAGDVPFPVRQLHFNDCHVDQLILVGINLDEKVSYWGQSRIGQTIRREPK